MSKKICVYATKNPEINAAISKLWKLKFGAVYDGCSIKRYPYLATDNSQEGTRLGDQCDREVNTLKELEAMPDYQEITIEIDGRNWSINTIKEALKKHADY